MKTIPISHFNGKRLADELVIYDRGTTSETNKYGFEAVVSRGIVVSLGGNDNKIPEGGFVVSGHGRGAKFLSENLCLGAKAEIDGDVLKIHVTDENRIAYCKNLILDIENRISLLRSQNSFFEREKAEKLLEDLKTALVNGDFENVKKLHEEAYYITVNSKKDEIRGVWHRPLEKNEEEVENTVLRFRNAGFNLMLIETNYGGYANACRCEADYLPLRENQKGGFDVIETFIRMGKKHGVEIHAWFENFFFGHEGGGCPIAELRPNWMARRKDGGMLLDNGEDFYFLNPAMEEVREFLLERCRELLDNYDFDGLQLDYIRYPLIKSLDRAAGFDENTKRMFLSDTGVDLDKIQTIESEDWKRFVLWCAEKVNIYVESVYNLIREYRKKGRYICLSTAVVGDPEKAITHKCQDWRLWVEKGWLDAIYPMAYYDDATEVEKEIFNMVQNYGNSPNISGISPMYNGLPLIETTKQIEACRKGGARGVALFAAEHCTEQELEKLKIGVFREIR